MQEIFVSLQDDHVSSKHAAGYFDRWRTTATGSQYL